MIELKHVQGRVIVAVDTQAKNWHTFEDGTKIRRERQYNEFNRNVSEPVNAVVISAEHIPSGSEIIIHPNAVHDSYRIFNYRQLSGKEEGSDTRYYSIDQEHCFIWLDENGDWQPLPPYATALRVFKPYTGSLTGIAPTIIKDVLYVLTGELQGKIVKTLSHCDHCITFQDTNGREGNVIKFRPFGDPRSKRDEEAIAIMDELTDELLEGSLLIGLTVSDAKPLKQIAYAD